jgi:DNA-binding CsgD family transcriptional regulator
MNNQPAALATLTEKQKECLRLVRNDYSSKEIGRQLGISQYAVDQRLRNATRQLQAQSRFAAARILREFEFPDNDNATYHSMVYDAPHLRADAQHASERGSDANRDQRPDNHSSSLRDTQALFGVSNIPAGEHWSPHLVSTGRESQVPLSLQARLLWVLVITTVSLFAFGAAVAGLEVLSRF